MFYGTGLGYLSNFNINVIIQSLAPRACYWRGTQAARFGNIGPHLVVLLESRMLDLELGNVPQSICGIDIIEIMLFKSEPSLFRAGGEFWSDLIFGRVSQSMRFNIQGECKMRLRRPLANDR